MADSVISRLKRHRFAYAFEDLKYPHAGQSAGRKMDLGQSSVQRSSAFISVHQRLIILARVLTGAAPG
jgi:hypothetical protein